MATDKLAPIAAPTATAVPMRTRTFRCDDDTWDAAGVRAAADGLDLSTVLRHYLVQYTASPRKRQSQRSTGGKRQSA